MSMNVSSINQTCTPNYINSTKQAQNIAFKAGESDKAEFSKQNNQKLTLEDKQQIIKSARKTAAGWGILGSIITTAYFGLRSDKTIAKKYDLDINNDKDLIKQIRKEQTLWTVPGIILPFAGALVTYIVAASMSSDNINIK